MTTMQRIKKQKKFSFCKENFLKMFPYKRKKNKFFFLRKHTLFHYFFFSFHPHNLNNELMSATLLKKEEVFFFSSLSLQSSRLKNIIFFAQDKHILKKIKNFF